MSLYYSGHGYLQPTMPLLRFSSARHQQTPAVSPASNTGFEVYENLASVLPAS